MQQIQSIDGGIGRLFVRDGVEGGGEKRLTPHRYNQGFAAGAGHSYQALKCPRCDSLNTKFCYYNNYNLSQPRYFCKGCRRYWTKGGVLRNVPVGGGCRKNKRSKQKSGTGDPSPNPQRKSSDSQNSNSDSSTVAADTSPEKANPTTVTTPVPFTLSEVAVTPANLFGFQESSTTDNRNHHYMLPKIETFKNLLTSSSDQLPLGFNSFMEQQNELQVVEKEELKRKQQWMDETTTYLRTSNGRVAAEDWEEGGGGLFDQWSQIPWSNQLNYFE